MARDPNEFLQKTKETLAKRAGQQCSNPGCRQSTSGPHAQDSRAVNIGEAAHIRGARPRSARYDPSMTPEQRRDISNGIWLCRTCAKLVDSDSSTYTVELLLAWKRHHEQSVLRPKGSASAVETRQALERYRSWLVTTTESFTVPGLSIALPITRAWIRLRAMEGAQPDVSQSKTMEERIAEYHDWGRLAQRYQHAHTFDVEHLTDFSRCVVVVGGPGAGKSTLLRRLAHSLCARGKAVLWARLPLVAQCVKSGRTLDDVILSVSTDGSGVGLALLRPALANPDYLLVDGLDECDPARESTAEAITRWAAGHEGTRVVITTRPIGHNPAWFFGWRHAELLPLGDTEVRAHARDILTVALEERREDIMECSGQFLSELKDNEIASLAARNPLFLGFLLQLFLNGVEFARTKAQLYHNVFEQALLHARPGRDTISLDQTVAWRAIEVAGWHALRTPSLRAAGLVNALGSDFAEALGLPSLAARTQAERALEFWQERGFLEELSAGNERGVAFVHLALAEYCAGRYAAQLGPCALQTWVDETRHAAKWQEAILLAAGAGAGEAIAQRLLELDDPQDPTSVEAILAAKVLAETAAPSAEQSKQVMDAIGSRLTSSVPYLVFEAAEAAMCLTKSAPDVVGPAVQGLLSHRQNSTRLAAVSLALACGESWIRVDTVEDALDFLSSEPVYTQRKRSALLGASDRLRSEALVQAVTRVLAGTPTSGTVRHVEDVVLNPGLSVQALRELETVLRATGNDGILATQRERWRERLSRSGLNQLRFPEYAKRADRAFLEATLAAAGSPDAPPFKGTGRGDLVQVGALLEALGFWELDLPAWSVLGRQDDADVVVAVLRGVMEAARIDKRALASEATWALAHLQESGALSELFDMVANVPVECDWEKAPEAQLDPMLLLRGLIHPSRAVVVAAGRLVASGAGGARMPGLVEVILRGAPGLTMQIVAAFAHDIWGSDAINVIVRRLEGELSAGCHWLFRCIPSLDIGVDSARVRDAIARGLFADEPHVAAGAAETLVALGCGELGLAEDLPRRALEHWMRRGSWCSRCGVAVHGGACRQCHIVPPDPRGDLVRALADLGAFEVEELLKLSCEDHHEIRRAACDALVDQAERNTMCLTAVLDAVRVGAAPPDVLRNVLSLPQTALASAKGQFVALFTSGVPAVREEALGGLTKGVIAKDQASEIARQALRDPDLLVRDAAVHTLRALRTS